MKYKDFGYGVSRIHEWGIISFKRYPYLIYSVHDYDYKLYIVVRPSNLQHDTITRHEIDTNLPGLGEPLTGAGHNRVDLSNPFI